MAYTVLLVDDNPYFHSEFTDYLSEFEIKSYTSGDAALTYLKEPNSVDFVILDENLKHSTSGSDIQKQINAQFPDLPVVIITGFADKNLAMKAMRQNALDIIEKPLTPEKINRIRDYILSVRGGQKYTETTGIPGKIEQIKNFIERNFDKKITILDIAKEVHLSPKYLSRLFKQETGKRFSDYKLFLRIEKSKDLLKNTGDSVDEIAYKLGYENSESFVRIFKRQEKTTPGKYRDEYRNDLKIQFHQENHEIPLAPYLLSEKLGVTLLNQEHIAIILQNAEGRILNWSIGAEKLYGWNKENIIGKNYRTIVPESDHSVFNEQIDRLNKGEIIDDFHAKRIHSDQSIVQTWIKMFKRTEPENSGSVITSLEIDVSDKNKQIKTLKKKTQRLIQKTTELEQISDEQKKELHKTRLTLKKKEHLSELGRMSAVVAHELRTPLSIIQTAVWNIKRKIKDTSITGNISSIEKMLEESERIISNILNYSRIQQPEIENINLTETIQQILHQYNQSKTTRCHLKYKYSVDLKSLNVPLDPNQLREMLVNLLNNAEEASPKENSQVIVTASLIKKGCIIAVKDFGDGISKEELKKIQKPFYTTKAKGTGLGLSVCKEMMKLHNGHLKINSVPGKHTIAKLIFPFPAH